MEFFQGLTDDQKALLGCGVALFLCGGMMVLSHSVRQFFSGGSSSAKTYRYQSQIAGSPQNDDDSDSQERKAA